MAYSKSSSTIWGGLTNTAAPNVPLFLPPTADVLAWFAETEAQVGALTAALAGSNLLVNSFFNLNQEFVTDAVTTNGNPAKYVTDGWLVQSTGAGTAVLSAQRVAAPFASAPGIPFGHRFTVSTAQSSIASGDLLRVAQRIEGTRFAPWLTGLNSIGASTVAFMARSSVALTLYAVLQSTERNRSYVKRFTLAANTDTLVSFVIPADTSTGTITADAAARGEFKIVLAAGSSSLGTLDAWQSSTFNAVSGVSNFAGTVNNAITFSGVVILPGNIPLTSALLPQLARQADEDLRLCQRYYAKTYPLATKPGTVINDGIIRGVASAAGTRLGMAWCLPASMRAKPTVTPYSHANGTASRLYGEDAFADLQVTINGISEALVSGIDISPATTGGGSVGGHFVADARL